jgi:hypothetical protein
MQTGWPALVDFLLMGIGCGDFFDSFNTALFLFNGPVQEVSQVDS